MKIKGFNYLDSSKLIYNYSNEDKIKFYTCIGGTPQYISRIDTAISFEDNINELYFNTSVYLYDEPTMILHQEMRELSLYNSIISAIAADNSKLNDITIETGEDRTKLGRYLDTLINLRIIHKEFPFGEDAAKSRKGIYKISDNCYSFWYKYVFANRSAIEQGVGSQVLTSILGELNGYMGRPFEDVSFQYMIEKNKSGKLPFLFTKSGK